MSARLDITDWIDEARKAKVIDVAVALGATLKGGAVEKVGPCPACGGDPRADRFGVNLRKNVFNCRRCGVGGDAIALAALVNGLDVRSPEGFERAVEIVTGRPRPGGARLSDEEYARMAAEREARQAEAARREEKRRRDEERYRERAIERARAEWGRARPAAGTPAEAYLRLRGVSLPASARIRYHPQLPYWREEGKAPLFTGPAMVAAITAGGQIIGLHRTWIDLDAKGGKREIADPQTGEILAAKKVLGSKRAGWIVLCAACGAAPERLVIGEGIETVLSVREALIEARSPLLDGTMFVSSVDLGNLAGKATERVRHPTLTKTDSLGRVQPVRVAGPEPDMSEPGLAIPASVREMLLLGDGDSEPVMTRYALERAARRHARRGLTIRGAFAPEGLDFNDLMRQAEEAT